MPKQFDEKPEQPDFDPHRPLNMVPTGHLHPSTYECLRPSEEQVFVMSLLRTAARQYSDMLEEFLPDGPDKTFILRAHRANAMWANVAVTRHADGAPRP